MQSFPSGHTANSFAAAIFTSLFLNAQLKVIADHASTIWALTATIAPLIGASLIAGSVYMSHVSVFPSSAYLLLLTNRA